MGEWRCSAEGRNEGMMAANVTACNKGGRCGHFDLPAIHSKSYLFRRLYGEDKLGNSDRLGTRSELSCSIGNVAVELFLFDRARSWRVFV